MSLPPNPNEQPFQPSDEDLERAREKAKLLDEKLMTVGLYSRRVDLAINPADNSLVLVAELVPGELAWSEKVQHPMQYEMVEELDDEITEDRVRQMMERARRFRETGELD